MRVAVRGAARASAAAANKDTKRHLVATFKAACTPKDETRRRGAFAPPMPAALTARTHAVTCSSGPLLLVVLRRADPSSSLPGRTALRRCLRCNYWSICHGRGACNSTAGAAGLGMPRRCAQHSRATVLAKAPRAPG